MINIFRIYIFVKLFSACRKILFNTKTTINRYIKKKDDKNKQECNF